ncbi:hypothetical protein [Jiangella gansuensis]|uniref:hypothetical protein n=1 Tax=Jiangella gansuensis TaxID=281473 RepID=UPI0012FCC2D4|nr:hypothetical protein [Jiangella gansuensis]
MVTGQGDLRRTVEDLLRLHAEVPRLTDAAGPEVTAPITALAETLRATGGKHRAVTELANDIAALAAGTADDLAPVVPASQAALRAAAHSVLGLLAVSHHQLDPLPPLGAVGDDLADAFPEGFARDYVRTVLDDLPRGRATTKDEAKSQPGADQAAIIASREAAIAAVAPKYREQVRAWLEHPDCHAVELHGPHVTDRELELRVGWTRPPNHGTPDADRWRVRDDDGKVVSRHSAGVEATRFSSPEAFVRPLEAFLDVAARHADGVDGFLDDHFAAGIAPVFVNSNSARLGPGGVVGFRGAGTGTKEAAKDWLKLRAAARKKDDECLPPVRSVAYDPIVEGSDPGVRLIFKKHADGWTMTTSYPAGEPSYDNVRLEELT